MEIGNNPKSIRVDVSWGGSGFMGIDVFSTDLSKNLWILNVCWVPIILVITPLLL